MIKRKEDEKKKEDKEKKNITFFILPAKDMAFNRSTPFISNFLLYLRP